jgi:hypothetical protein
MSIIKIRNWEEHQHYKNRNPPWIRLHKKILDDPDFHDLSGYDFKLLAMCWLVASEDKSMEGNLPCSRKLAFRLRISEEELFSFISRVSSWIYTDDSEVLASCEQDAVPDNSETDNSKTETELFEKAEGFSPDSEEVRLSELLFKLIQERNQNHKKPNIQNWAKQIDLMIRRDNREPQHIANVIAWAQSDEFWQDNILSTKKLRAQFDALVLKMSKATTGSGKVITASHPHFKKIQLLSRIVSRKASDSELSEYANIGEQMPEMLARAAEEKERLLRQ